MAIIFHPHALVRMDERGATREEVLKTISEGRTSAARYGRRIYSMVFPFGDFWRANFYEHKMVEAFCIEEGEDMIAITVVVKYF